MFSKCPTQFFLFFFTNTPTNTISVQSLYVCDAAFSVSHNYWRWSRWVVPDHTRSYSG